MRTRPPSIRPATAARPTRAFASINFAANSSNNTGLVPTNGDVIYVLPGHVENIGNATLTCNTAGVRVIGVGTGTDRPLISFNNTNANIAITAANVTLRNFQVTATVANVAKLFSVTAAYCILDSVDYVDTASSNPLSFVLTTARRPATSPCRTATITARRPATPPRYGSSSSA